MVGVCREAFLKPQEAPGILAVQFISVLSLSDVGGRDEW